MSVLDPGLLRLYQVLASSQLPIMVGGSVAAIFYGEPRSTLDISVVVDAHEGMPSSWSLYSMLTTSTFRPSNRYVPRSGVAPGDSSTSST